MTPQTRRLQAIKAAAGPLRAAWRVKPCGCNACSGSTPRRLIHRPKVIHRTLIHRLWISQKLKISANLSGIHTPRPEVVSRRTVQRRLRAERAAT